MKEVKNVSCYHPLLAVKYTVDQTEWTIIGSVKDGDVYDLSFYKRMFIPCGHCIGCRLDYSRHWADRMALEKETCGDAIFLTLTYDQEHLPVCYIYGDLEFGTLVKDDLQKFWKRLRKRLNKKCRYYASGEYGDLTERPHYHAIVFGLSIEDFPDAQYDGKNEFGQPYYRSELLEDIWSFGRCCLASADWSSMAYVSRYVTKKVIGNDTRGHEFLGRINEFSTMSRKPGLGRYWFDQNIDRIEEFGLTHIEIPTRGSVIMPRYFKNLLTEEQRNSIFGSEDIDVSDIVLKKIHGTNLSFIEQLEVEEGAKIDLVKKWKRDFS